MATGLVLVAAMGCGGADAEGSSNPVLDGTGDVAAGAELYAATCAVCHGADAGGTTTGPPFLH